jgi:hypothetical protein
MALRLPLLSLWHVLPALRVKGIDVCNIGDSSELAIKEKLILYRVFSIALRPTTAKLFVSTFFRSVVFLLSYNSNHAGVATR